jgi:hypothetical protein
VARSTPQRSESPINPYAADGYWNNYGVATMAGADPSNYGDGASPSGAGGRWDNGGWAQRLTRDDYSGTPDPTRLEELPRTDRRASLRNFWGWWAGYDADTRRRESVTEQQTVGWTEQKGTRPRGPDPRWTPPPEPRPTTAMSPHSYYFQRPFDQDVARRFTGAHMSMADNRRNYPILLQSPIPNRRNTFRVEPGPMDQDIIDEAPDAASGPQNRVPYVDLPLATYQRSYRAG